MGASWAVIGIITPVIFQVCAAADHSMTILALSASLAGAVMGDHCSPISDTTILASAGAECRHMMHVATQMPYALTAGAFCLIGYLIVGSLHTRAYSTIVGVSLGFCIAALLVFLVIIGRRKPAKRRKQP